MHINVRQSMKLYKFAYCLCLSFFILLFLNNNNSMFCFVFPFPFFMRRFLCWFDQPSEHIVVHGLFLKKCFSFSCYDYCYCSSCWLLHANLAIFIQSFPVPYNVHTHNIHHHHIQHVPIYKPVPIVKHVPVHVVKEVAIPVHLPEYKEGWTPAAQWW